MPLKNKYANRSKISEAKIRQIVKFFSLDLDASQITKITGLNRNTINRYLTEIRKRIAQFCDQQSLSLVRLKLMKASSAHVELKVKEAVEHLVKLSFLESSDAMGKSIQRLFLIVVDPRCKRLFEVG